jgi:pimeloyl-ACP methyl ester carboxylesterase
VLCWGDPASITPERPPLVLLHGYMDVAATFQFVVDALREIEGSARYFIAPDLRGYGLTDTPAADCYWFLDYIADLEAVLAELGHDGVIDLLGHSMGGNVAMMYAGLRPTRVRRLVNLEGFGLPDAGSSGWTSSGSRRACAPSRASSRSPRSCARTTRG